MKKALIAAIAALIAAFIAAPAASAIDRVNTGELRNGVTVDGILEHERALQDIAIANDGNRAATTPGMTPRSSTSPTRLRRAGYRVTLDAVQLPDLDAERSVHPERTSPATRPTYGEDTDYIVSQFSAAGDVTGPIFVARRTEFRRPVAPGFRRAAVIPADFAGIPAGAIALIQRGTCPFTQKFQNALDAGAAAALIFNDGFEGRTTRSSITAPTDTTIPLAMISSDDRRGARSAAGATVRIVVDATTTPNEEYQRDRRLAARQQVPHLVVGAHLDSVEAGPGINDNGSGTSGILEIAEQIAKLEPESAQPPAVRLLGRRGGRARGLDRLRGRPCVEQR